MKYLALLILCILNTTIFSQSLIGNVSQFFALSENSKTKAYLYFVPSVTNKQAHENFEAGWKSFHNSSFKLPILLEQVVQEKKPVILFVPKKHDVFTPTDKKSPWIEGARVAMAWASAYNRFKYLGNVDLRIVYFNKNDDLTQQTVIQTIDKAASIKIISNQEETPETQIEKHIFNFNELRNTSVNASLSLNVLKIKTPQIKNFTIIKPKLAQQKQSQKRILLVGGAGFIGTYLTHKLLKQGHQVIVLDNLSCCTAKHVNKLENNKNFSFHQIDASQPFDIEGPLTHIVHLASIPTPPVYYRMPKETLVTGLDCTKITVELARKKNACYLFASTSEVYGDPEVNPQPETYHGCVNPIGKRSQYDQSKRGAETLLKLYFDKYNMDIRIMRIFNTYGPYMQIDDGRVITNFIQAALENKTMTIYGSGRQSRSFSYVSDTVDGILRLLFAGNLEHNKIEDRIFNIGNTEEYSILELANIVNDVTDKHLGKKIHINHIKQFDKDDPKIRKPDLTKIKKKLGYNPVIDIYQGIEKTLLFFKKEYSHEQ